ncbi:hypothetical protein PHYSODRAFT_488796, partial [Phytophthora sojae]
ADDIASKFESVAAKYPEGLSKTALQQIVKVEEQRMVDLKAGKATGDVLRRDVKLFPGMQRAPVSTSHVGRGAQRYEDGNRLLDFVNPHPSRPAKQGGGDVLLISSSKPQKRDWLLPKGGWDHGEKARVAARLYLLVVAVLQVAGIKPKMLPKTEFKNKDGEGHVYYPFKMTAKTVYDQWPESMRYRIWVSYDDAIKLLANRKEMVDIVNAARAVRN